MSRWDDPERVYDMVTRLIDAVEKAYPQIPRHDAWEELCADVGSRKMDRAVWPEAYRAGRGWTG